MHRNSSGKTNFCMNGHLWTPENTYTKPNGKRSCRICNQIRSREYNKQNRVYREKIERKYRARLAEAIQATRRQERYSEAEKTLILEAAEQGKSYKEIACTYGRSVRAIKDKLNEWRNFK